ncbi:MAG: hypothetical protein EOO03_08225 [Chitinophagaceae bacterium]|nr:MAG: hypothetical protein EOO03_08225 [Chitinophagaceae bacterium]
MTHTIKRITLGIMAAAIAFSSCKKSNGGEGNDEELITTVKLTFTPTSGTGTPVTFSFKDADGNGGNPPTQDIIQLAANTSYNVAIQLLNESIAPAEDITPEIVEEAEAHRFYYTPSAGSLLTVNNLNTDANGVPVGLTSTWAAGAVSSGTIGVTLRHYPGTPPDKQTSDPVNSPKSGTDVVVTFSYNIL